jgi:hypothetical protein
MSDIFISYNNEDRLRARMFAETLGGRGWSIFWDRAIPTGKTWPETIGRELEEARCVVVLWSNTSIKSAWVRDEADDAKARGVLFPVRIDNIQPPIGFRGFQTADLVNWKPNVPSEQFDTLIADIAALIGPPPATGPIPRPTVTAITPTKRETPQYQKPISTPSSFQIGTIPKPSVPGTEGIRSQTPVSPPQSNAVSAAIFSAMTNATAVSVYYLLDYLSWNYRYIPLYANACIAFVIMAGHWNVKDWNTKAHYIVTINCLFTIVLIFILIHRH